MSSSDESDSYSSDDAPPNIRNSHIYKMQNERFKIFKSQDPENGHFDITFEIEGKKLFANKIFLTSVSETLNVLLSERWTNKDEAIKLETYSYDNFYEFLSFIYIGHCNLNSENVFQHVDMAEFYAVSFLKKFCHDFLLSMRYNVETVVEMFEFSQKYSLSKMEKALGVFIYHNIDGVINDENFLSSKKAFVDFLYRNYGYLKQEKCFEAAYKWTEHQVIQRQRSGEDKNFSLVEAVKDEFCSSFPQANVNWRMTSNFLINFVFEKGLFFSPEEFKDYYIHKNNDIICHEDFEDCPKNHVGDLKNIYALAEKQALKKHELSPNENFNLADSIKADLVYVIPCISFVEMSKKFLMDYVVAKGIISEEQARHVRKTRVCIQNGSSRIFGIFNDDIKGYAGKICLIYSRFSDLVHLFNQNKNPFQVNSQSSNKICFSTAKFIVPSTSNTVTKMKGVEWYLCLDKDGFLTFNHYTMVVRSDYLLAEMKSQNQFVLTPGETTTLTARYNNLEPVV